MTASVYSRINEVHIEITNMCNLKCAYCYAETLLPGKDLSSKLFTTELYRTTVQKLLSETRSPFVDIVFHGGEPLLHDAEWFDEACTFAADFARRLGKRIGFSMQSNLTMLRDAHVEVFKRYDVRIGVSLDGDRQTHNAMRGQFDRTIENIRKVRDAGLLGGVIVVVSHHNYDRISGVFEVLMSLGVPTFHLNIASSVGRGDGVAPLGTEKTFQAWKSCLDGMIEHQGRIVDTRLLKKIEMYLGPPLKAKEVLSSLRCDNAFCHAGVTMVAVQHDGSVFPCGCAGSSGNMKNFKLDSLGKGVGATDESHYALLKRFHAKSEKYYNECVRCPARFVCEHGCPAFDHTDPITPENTCEATKMLYRYLGKLDRVVLEHLVVRHHRTVDNVAEASS